MAVGKDKVWMCVWRMECLDAKTIIMNIFLISFGRRVRWAWALTRCCVCVGNSGPRFIATIFTRFIQSLLEVCAMNSLFAPFIVISPLWTAITLRKSLSLVFIGLRLDFLPIPWTIAVCLPIFLWDYWEKFIFCLFGPLLSFPFIRLRVILSLMRLRQCFLLSIDVPFEHIILMSPDVLSKLQLFRLLLQTGCPCLWWSARAVVPIYQFSDGFVRLPLILWFFVRGVSLKWQPCVVLPLFFLSFVRLGSVCWPVAIFSLWSLGVRCSC